ncbi:FAD-dependent monooxygenase cctM [Apiospora aurea]|uniref:FAD-dependent monooxygenase cctM n=1 Tax=Apiospora aurea TaxID=335848 RepID=A0ABR1PXJ3_9PEZI
MSSKGPSPHILILGAGLGGLSLAQALRKRGISLEIFERDNRDLERPHGWAVSVHSMVGDMKESVADDMPPFNTVDHLDSVDIPCEFAYYNPDSTTKMGYRDDGSRTYMWANRSTLRNWLSTHIDIQYDKHAIRIEESDKNVTVNFKDGSSATGDILVGAEGVHSMTRKYILKGNDPVQSDKLFLVSGDVHLTKPEMESQMTLSHSSYLVDFPGADDGKTYHLFVGLDKLSSPSGPQSGAEYYFHLTGEDEAADGDGFWTYSATREELCAFALRQARDLPERFRCVIGKATVERMKRPPVRLNTLIMESLPVGTVTLLGDAAHVMTPFRGEGGCHAMKGGLNLARAIDKIDKGSDQNLREPLDEYQKEVIKRGCGAAAMSGKEYTTAIGHEKPDSRAVAGMAMVALPQERVVLWPLI